MSSTSKGVYPNAPLALVALEIRFPSEASAAPVTVPIQRAMRERLAGHGEWVIEAQQAHEIELAFGPTPSQNIHTRAIPRLLTRDRTVAVTMPAGAITVETTRYDGYDSFRKLVVSVVEAVEDLLAPDGVVRFGLRYIDEIRVPDLIEGDMSVWSKWLAPDLLPPRLPSSGVDAALQTWASAAQYRIDKDRFLVVRYGPQPLPVVNPTTPLRRLSPPPQAPVFVLDFDSHWQPETVPGFVASELMDLCDLLHAPASDSFEAFITEPLRKVFRGDA